MILYFTGTGNTQFAAEYIADHIGDECISLNEIIKSGSRRSFSSERPFVIAAPIYAWRFPLIIEEFIRNAKFSGNRRIYYIGTMESQSGNCGKYLKELTESKNMEFMGFCGISMPSNYIIAGRLPDEEQARKHIMASLPLMKSVTEKIAAGEIIEKNDKTPFASIASGAVNVLFNKFLVNSKGFNVSEKCVSCGKCEKACPVNNITLNNGIPVFGENCLNCYSCINRCPQEAINIGRRTHKNGRYICPVYADWKEQ